MDNNVFTSVVFKYEKTCKVHPDDCKDEYMQRRCGPLPNYFGHLLTVSLKKPDLRSLPTSTSRCLSLSTLLTRVYGAGVRSNHSGSGQEHYILYRVHR